MDLYASARSPVANVRFARFATFKTAQTNRLNVAYERVTTGPFTLREPPTNR